MLTLFFGRLIGCAVNSALVVVACSADLSVPGQPAEIVGRTILIAAYAFTVCVQWRDFDKGVN